MDHYQVLGLFSTEIDCTNITEAEIKKAYRKRALELHPDKNNSSDAASFQQLQASYSVLTNKELREKFDHEWRSKRQKEEKARKKEESEGGKKDKCFDYKAWKEEMVERRRYEREIFEYESRMKEEEKERKEREFWKMRVMTVKWDKDDNNGVFNEHQIREIFKYFGEVEDVVMLEKKRYTYVALVLMASMDSMVAAVAAKWVHPHPRFVVRPMYSYPVTGHM